MRTTQLWMGRLSAAGLLITFLLWGQAVSAQDLINFDNFPNLQNVSTQYESSCVTFTGTGGATGRGETISSGFITAETPPNVLLNSDINNEFSGGPLTVTFTQPQTTVSLYGGYVLAGGEPATLSGTLTAFDQAGNPLPASDGQVSNTLTVNGGTVVNNQFMVSSSQANIWSVTLSFGDLIFTAIDNLQFNGCPTGPGIASPTVTGLTVNGQPSGPILDLGLPLTVLASVSGQDLDPNVTVTLTYLTAPPGQAPQTVTATAPVVNGQVNALLFPNLPVGTYQVTVTAMNSAGETGAETTTVFYAIPAFFNTELQGNFQYSFEQDNCQIAVFSDTGAWGVPNGSDGTAASIYNIPQPLWTKWQQVRATASSSRTALSWVTLGGDDGALGCPTDNATPNFPFYPGPQFTPPSIEYLIQDFERGRIYGNLRGPDAGIAYYVPTAFTTVIDSLSTYVDPNSSFPASVLQSSPLVTLNLTDPFGVNEVGMPISDPIYDLTNPEPVFLFQRFLPPEFCMVPLYLLQLNNPNFDPNFPTYPSQADCLSHGGTPNTLEIRAPSLGQSPSLYVERVGGSLMDYEAAAGNTPTLGAGVSAVWEQYACNTVSLNGKMDCPVSHYHIKSVSPANTTPLYTDQNLIPQDDNYCGVLPGVGWGTVEFVLGGTAGTTTEWSAIPGKGASSVEPSAADYINITTEGWIIQSATSGGDFPPTHYNMNYPTSDDWFILPLCLVDCDIGDEISAKEDGAWSDYFFHIRPLAVPGVTDPNANYVFFPAGTPADGGPPVFWNLLGAQADPSTDGLANAAAVGMIEIEYEDAWQHQMLRLPGFHHPTVGHLLITSGRWNIDCGHPPVHSEIHPPNMVTEVATGQPPTAMTTTDSVVTRAQVWFNELYTGNPVTTQIWPLPRPEPDAVLSAYVVSFYDPPLITQTSPIPPGGTAVTVGFSEDLNETDPNSLSTATASLSDTGLVLSASGPPGTHVVQDTGQVMNPQDNGSFALGTFGSYTGAWYVGWVSPAENPCIAGSCL